MTPQEIDDRIKELANSHDAIEKVIVSVDRSNFLLLGRTWTPELSKIGAKLSIDLSKNNDTWIDGGYWDAIDYSPPDMIFILNKQHKASVIS